MRETIHAGAAAAAAFVGKNTHAERVLLHGRFEVECRGADGSLKWRDTIENLVTTVGKNDILDKYLGLAAPSAIHMGLKGTGTAVVGDTMGSHGAWLEVGGTNAPAYSGNRPAPAFSAASGGSKVTSSAVSFTFTSGGTVAGCFVVMSGVATKDNTTGVLYSAGDFTQGNRTVVSTDVINVTYTASA